MVLVNPNSTDPMAVTKANSKSKYRIAISLGLFLAVFSVLGQSRSGYGNTTLLPNGKQCFSATVGINGFVGTLGAITGGTLYTAGTYPNVPLTGGTGTLATANITVAGGAVTSVVVVNTGTGYTVGDTLSAASVNIGGTGSGFSVPVASVSINSSLSGGKVSMFIPSTTTPKNTWQDPNQTTLNSNPIILDSNGCAVIYGIGSYRQQLFDSLGNLIWDQLTTDTSASNSVFYAGISGGSPNAITVTDSGFNSTDGSIINFIALNTNTGATTLNPGTGAIPVVKDTSAGPVALTGGEIQTNNVISVQYQSATNTFHILNLVAAAASSQQAPLCGEINLSLFNDAVAPNSTMDATADSAVMINTGGAVINRSSISVTINLTLSGAAGGLDSRDTFGANQFYNGFLIDNGVVTSGFASSTTHGNAPSLPSGYTYKCRIGAFSTGADGNLQRTRQNAQISEPIVTPGTNTANPQIMARKTFGTFSTTSPTWSSLVTSGFIPPTAQRICVNLFATGSNAAVMAAPNANYGGPASTIVPPCIAIGNVQGVTVFGPSNNCWFNLQNPASISIVSSAADGVVELCGWSDAVNAH